MSNRVNPYNVVEGQMCAVSVDYAVKKKPRRQRVLELLWDLQWHSHLDLHRVGGVRYSARLLELKRKGYKIEDRPADDGKDYRLTSRKPGVPQQKKVKVFLTEAEAQVAITWLPGYGMDKHARSARAAITDALGSFRANRHKL